MEPLELVQLPLLMKHSSGKAEIVVGLIDGPVDMDHPDLASGNIHGIPGETQGRCSQADSAACLHGTLVAGLLCARRDSAALAICPDCTLMVRPIFSETMSWADGGTLSATPGELAAALIDCV